MIILFIIVWGMAAGWIAQLVMGERTNWGQALALGLAGSLVGGLLASLLSGDGLALRFSGIRLDHRRDRPAGDRSPRPSRAPARVSTEP